MHIEYEKRIVFLKYRTIDNKIIIEMLEKQLNNKNDAIFN